MLLHSRLNVHNYFAYRLTIHQYMQCSNRVLNPLFTFTGEKIGISNQIFLEYDKKYKLDFSYQTLERGRDGNCEMPEDFIRDF